VAASHQTSTGHATSSNNQFTLSLLNVEKTVTQQSTNDTASLTVLSSFLRSFDAYLAIQKSPSSFPQIVAGNGTLSPFPASTRIDQLTNTTINTPTIAGGSISGASIAGYLPLSGGTLTGSVVFSTSPTFAGTPIFSGGLLNYSVKSTSTIPNNSPYAWTIATSSTGTPLLSIDTTSGAETVSFGSPGSNVIIGAAGQGADLVFQENSLISGVAPGRTLTFGANSDIINFGVNIGFGTTTPLSRLAVSGGASIGANYNIAAPSNGLIVQGNVGIGNSSPFYALDVGGFVNTNDTSGYRIGGANALYASSSASQILAIGPGAGAAIIANATSSSLTSGLFNTAIGYQALNLATSTSYSTAVGYQALKNMVVQAANSGNSTAVGYLALSSNTYGVSNDAFGYTTLHSNTTGQNNTGLGTRALESNTTGNDNVSIGFRSLGNGVNNGANIGIGMDVMRYATTTSSNNVAIGEAAGNGNAIAYANAVGNVLVGYQNGFNFSTGATRNTLLGYRAGYDVTTGSNNTMLGQFNTTGASITTGSGNILIGNGVRNGLSQTGSNQLNLGNLIFGTNLAADTTLSTGSIGIGTTSPTAQLSTTGTVRFSNFGAGTLTTDASGNLSVSSDERLKNIDGAFSRGLADIVKLDPIQYHWNATSGLDTATQYAGFSAQNVQHAIPEAVGSMVAPCHASSSADEARDPGSGPSAVRPCDSAPRYLTLQDRPLIAALVNAVKEIAVITGTFKDALVAWLGNAGNGIHVFFAESVRAKNELCVGNTCVTAEQFKAMVAAAGQTAASASAGGDTSTGGVASGTSALIPHLPPDIEIHGINPTHLSVGDTYADLGAVITGPTAEDRNLGLHTFVDGVLMNVPFIDTSAAGTHTISYVATNAAGTATSTRTVNVVDSNPAPVVSPAIVSDIATSTSAN